MGLLVECSFSLDPRFPVYTPNITMLANHILAIKDLHKLLSSKVTVI